MVNVVLVENSNLANVNIQFSIISLRWAEEDLVKINSSNGFSYLIRPSYLETLKKEDLHEHISLTDDNILDIQNATYCYQAEQKAFSYITKREHNRTQLQQKLGLKGFPYSITEKVLDRLESFDYLNDKRFALMWLENRVIRNSEGKIKLLSQLVSHGIDGKLAKECINIFLLSFSEDELIQKAYEKCIRQNKNKEQIIKTLRNKGFSFSNINKIIENI